MSENGIRLVYCSSSATGEARSPDYNRARQLSLFDDFDRVKVLFLPVSDLSSHQFFGFLNANEPHLLVDTRDYPEFFSIFPSTERAFEEFGRRGILYKRVPLHPSQEGGSFWKSLDLMKEIFLDYAGRKSMAPIFFLSSTRRKADRMSESLIGYISQELCDLKLERIEP